MRITEYNVELSDMETNILVKERESFYDCFNGDALTTPTEISNMMKEVFRLDKKAEEYVYMIAFNTKCKPIGIFEISHGTVNACLCNPREIFIRALLVGASSIVMVHNHPSGDCTPSSTDIKCHKRIKSCSDILNVQLLDNVIIGDRYYSFKENGFL